MTFLEYFDRYIITSPNHERTKAKYRGTYNHLESYQDDKKIVLQFDDIDNNFAKDFGPWMYKTNESSQNTLAKNLSVIKQVMKDAEIENCHSNTQYKRIGVSRVKTSRAILELSELEMIAKADFTDSVELDQRRDLFLIASYTGLRYSDFSRLTADHVFAKDGMEYIDMYQYKGRETKADTQVIIPVLPQLKRILVKYNYKFPTAPVEQVMNRNIKTIVNRAKVEREMIYKSSKAGKTVTKTIKVADKCTNHTARFTFINIMINDFDISPMDLQKITGQTLDTLVGYERGDKKKNAAKVYSKVIEKMKEIDSTKLRAI